VAPETGSSGNVIAVVPAAGSGERLAAGIPKAFCEVAGRTLLERAVGGLLESGVVDHVVVAVPVDRIDEAKRVLADRAAVVAGGPDRTQSVNLALAALPATAAPAFVLLHDTIKAVDANGVVLGTPERAGLRAVQTPQGFATELLLRAYRAGAGAAGFTDDASLVEHVGGQVQVVDGDPLAFKITTQLDLLLAEAIVRR